MNVRKWEISQSYQCFLKIYVYRGLKLELLKVSECEINIFVALRKENVFFFFFFYLGPVQLAPEN